MHSSTVFFQQLWKAQADDVALLTRQSRKHFCDHAFYHSAQGNCLKFHSKLTLVLQGYYFNIWLSGFRKWWLKHLTAKQNPALLITIYSSHSQKESRRHPGCSLVDDASSHQRFALGRDEIYSYLQKNVVGNTVKPSRLWPDKTLSYFHNNKSLCQLPVVQLHAALIGAGCQNIINRKNKQEKWTLCPQYFQWRK